MPPVPRLDALDSETFQAEYVQKCRPVVLTGIAAQWPATRTWSIPYLQEHAGKVIVSVRRTSTDAVELDEACMDRGYQNLFHMLNECERNPELETYTPGICATQIPSLMTDVRTPELLEGVNIASRVLFLGQNGRGFGHMHPYSQALLCQVTGTKAMDLYAPKDLGKVHMRRPWEHGFWRSKVNFHNIDHSRFPKLALAEKWTAHLQSGDALFIPLHWLHVPTSGAFSTALTYWWRAHPREVRHAGTVLRSVVGVGGMFARQEQQRAQTWARNSGRKVRLRLARLRAG